MSDPIEVLKGSDCDLCLAVWKRLDEAHAAGRTASTEDTPEETDQHVLGAICSWWVAHSLAQTKGGVQPLMRCLQNAFAEHGINITPQQVRVQ